MLIADEIAGIFTFPFSQKGSNNQTTLSLLFSQRLPASRQPVSSTPTLLWSSSSDWAQPGEPDLPETDWQPRSSKPPSFPSPAPGLRLPHAAAGLLPSVPFFLSAPCTLCGQAHPPKDEVIFLLSKVLCAWIKPKLTLAFNDFYSLGPVNLSGLVALFSSYTGLGSVEPITCRPTCPGLSVSAQAIPTMKNACRHLLQLPWLKAILYPCIYLVI